MRFRFFVSSLISASNLLDSNLLDALRCQHDARLITTPETSVLDCRRSLPLEAITALALCKF